MDTTILASILGGLVSGLFTFLGVLITIRYYSKKDAIEEERRKKAENQVIENEKPRFEIAGYNEISKYNEKLDDADISVFFAGIKGYDKAGRRFSYDEGVGDKNNWVNVDYVLKNIGQTEIDHLYIMTGLPKNTSLFNVTGDSYLFAYSHGLLNYSVIFDKNIKIGQSVKLRVSYLKDQIILSNLGSATLTIWLMDVNNNVWTQPLFAPSEKIYNSSRSRMKLFKQEDDISAAIECFENPMLW